MGSGSAVRPTAERVVLGTLRLGVVFLPEACQFRTGCRVGLAPADLACAATAPRGCFELDDGRDVASGQTVAGDTDELLIGATRGAERVIAGKAHLDS
jgi:hypothetical protein